jgi:hypothetical protein
MGKISEILTTMDYGLAPESDEHAPPGPTSKAAYACAARRR